MESVRCNYCGRNSTEELYSIPDYMLHDNQRTTLARCRHCGLVYQNPRLPPEALQEHYPQEYASFHASKSPLKKRPFRKWLDSYGLLQRARIVRAEKPNGRILDVGCAVGAFLLAMPSGWDLFGVEPNSYAAEVARQAGLNVFNGTLKAARYPNEYFDAVTLWDVLEHLPDPTASLCEIHRILKPDGVLIVRVPNLSSWEAQLFGRYWAGLDAPRHLYVFSLDSLKKMLAKNGYSRQKRTASPGLYPAFLLSLRFWLGGRGLPGSKVNFLLRWLESPWMKLLMAPFFYLLGFSSRAGWVVLVAHKDQGT